MRNLIAVAAFSILVGLLVFNAQLEPDAAIPQATAAGIPKIEARTWARLASPAPVPSPAASPARDLFAAP